MTEVSREKDGRRWRIGGDGIAAWIVDGTTAGRGISCAIPPLFEAYATLELPGTPNGRGGWARSHEDLREQQEQDSLALSVLCQHTVSQPWWLGYLDTGSADTVFYDVPMVCMFPTWNYVLVEAGPEQAGSWRADDPWKGVLPDLIFPRDRTWLVSTLWDDFWRCIGGSRELVDGFLNCEGLSHRVREVQLSDDDVAPPGHFSA
jgi:hypothetical protein